MRSKRKGGTENDSSVVGPSNWVKTAGNRPWQEMGTYFEGETKIPVLKFLIRSAYVVFHGGMTFSELEALSYSSFPGA